MLNRRKDFPVGSWITLELVGYQFPRRFPLTLQHLAKEPLSSTLVSSLRYQNVERIAVLIDGSPKVQLLSLNLYKDFVDMPRITQPALLSSDGSGILRPKLQAPKPNGLIGDGETPLGKEILNITEAEHESMIQPD
jgi:hypothetical protein